VCEIALWRTEGSICFVYREGEERRKKIDPIAVKNAVRSAGRRLKTSTEKIKKNKNQKGPGEVAIISKREK